MERGGRTGSLDKGEGFPDESARLGKRYGGRNEGRLERNCGDQRGCRGLGGKMGGGRCGLAFPAPPMKTPWRFARAHGGATGLTASV